MITSAAQCELLSKHYAFIGDAPENLPVCFYAGDGDTVVAVLDGGSNGCSSFTAIKLVRNGDTTFASWSDDFSDKSAAINASLIRFAA